MWLNESVIYHIYPLGLCGAPKNNDGISQNRLAVLDAYLPHLQRLGGTAVYFSPVFQSDRHGYDTRDYTQIDCRLGTNESFAELCGKLHKQGIRVILDGVFNHVGRGFFAFEDLLKNRENSPYRDWFFVDFNGNTPYNDGLHYAAWEGHYELVKLNLRNEAVISYLFDAVTQWVRQFDIDGLRLDVAYCLDRDFLRRLRSFTQGLKQDFALIGELLFGDYRQLVNGEMLHSCTNYEAYKSLYSAFNSSNLYELSYSMNRCFGTQDWCMYKGLQLLTFADNHDVSRIATQLAEKRQLPALYATLFAMSGIPTLYYGSEWGVAGDKKDGDDALRPALPSPQWNELTDVIQKLISIRKSNKALQYGYYANLKENNTSLLFKRCAEGESVLFAVNITAAEATIAHGELNGEFTELFTDRQSALNGYITLPPFGFAILKK